MRSCSDGDGMILRPLALLLVTGLLAACGQQASQLLVPQTPTELRLRPAVGSLEVRDISLPAYAAGSDVLALTGANRLDVVPGVIWADGPERALTQNLAAALGTITGARVSTEPWAFAEPPAASLTVRVTRLAGAPGGTLEFAGQYVLAPVASGLADRAGDFAIRVPVAGDTPEALAAAQGQAVAELAETVARRLAR